MTDQERAEKPIGHLTLSGEEYEILNVLDSDMTEGDEEYAYRYMEIMWRTKHDQS